MAHWAEIDENNKVIQVLVGSNDDPDEGYQWLIDNKGGTWIKCSYNTTCGEHMLGGEPLRYNYPGQDWTYDPVKDAFIAPKPQENWVLNESSCCWEPKRPESPGQGYFWDEQTYSWIKDIDV